MDQKVGQATGPEVFVQVGHLARLLGASLSLALRSPIVHCSVFPPRTTSDLALLRSNAASRSQHLNVLKGSIPYSFQALGNDVHSDFHVATRHVSGISVPAEEELKISVSCASRRGMMPASLWGSPAGAGIREKEWANVKRTQSSPGLDFFECWSGNILSGKMLLASNDHQSSGEIRVHYAAGVVLLLRHMAE
jgi:hypothetical protein